MIDALLWLFGEGKDLSAGQMAARAVVIFVIALAVVRTAGRRSFGQQTPFDACMTVLIGAVLSRAVTGASAFWPTVAAAATIAILHRLVAMACLHARWFEQLLTGAERELVRDGRPDPQAMRKGLISQRDLQDAVRQKTGREDLAGVRRAVLQRDGTITVVAGDQA
jgi:uncharacterized membrane protein YcaP (DUF421 family)